MIENQTLIALIHALIDLYGRGEGKGECDGDGDGENDSESDGEDGGMRGYEVIGGRIRGEAEVQS